MANNVTKLRKRKANQKREWSWPSFISAWQESESYEDVLEQLGFEDTKAYKQKLILQNGE